MTMANHHVLVVGGQRSGKSRFAENLVTASRREAVYVATATAGDSEMADRIRVHRTRRGLTWRTVEEPLDLAGVLRREATPEVAILVDCLTLWLSNVTGANLEPDQLTDKLAAAVSRAPGAVVLVTNEVGSGVIPDNPLGRRYADALGTLNQTIAATVGRVVLVAAGQPVVLKPAAEAEFFL